MESKFRYLIFPENIYTIHLEEGANPITIEISGKELVNKLKKQMLLDMPTDYEV